MIQIIAMMIPPKCRGVLTIALYNVAVRSGGWWGLETSQTGVVITPPSGGMASTARQLDCFRLLI